MNYEQELINIIRSINDNRVLAFVYGMLEYLMEYLEGHSMNRP